MNKKITRYDLIEWIDRPPSNSDLDICNYIIDLQQRIDEAIEYIKECTSSPDEYENFISTSETKRLLEILGGKE